MSKLKCDCNPQNPDRILEALETMTSLEDIQLLVEFFKVMGDTTRLRILIALEKNEFCVSDLSCMLNMTQSAISHQLKALKNAKLIKSRRDGRIIYYSLDDDHIKDILAQSMTHVLDC
jgi:ArsR family transcriptional regulator